MAGTETFFEIHQKAIRAGIFPHTNKSKKWFLDKLKAYRSKVKPKNLIRDSLTEKRARVLPGKVYMFIYDPKHKDSLPYYDTFPLIVMVDKAPGGFYGLNLHYLPPTARAHFFDMLMDNLNNREMDETTRFKVNYQKLKAAQKYRAFAPCFKHYLTGHVKSHFAEVRPLEWEMAMFLPTDQFVKEDRNKIWRKAKRHLR